MENEKVKTLRTPQSITPSSLDFQSRKSEKLNMRQFMDICHEAKKLLAFASKD